MNLAVDLAVPIPLNQFTGIIDKIVNTNNNLHILFDYNGNDNARIQFSITSFIKPKPNIGTGITFIVPGDKLVTIISDITSKGYEEVILYFEGLDTQTPSAGFLVNEPIENTLIMHSSQLQGDGKYLFKKRTVFTVLFY